MNERTLYPASWRSRVNVGSMDLDAGVVLERLLGSEVARNLRVGAQCHLYGECG